MDIKEVDLQRLKLDEKIAQQEYGVRLRELELKESEKTTSHWRSPLVLSITAAAIAAAGNMYISGLNGANQLSVESTRIAGQQAIDREKAQAERILEATKSSNPKDAAVKIKFLIDIGLISDPNRQAALEAYLKSEEPNAASTPKQNPILVPFKSDWLGGGNNQANQCAIGRTVVTQNNPGKTILLKSSSEESKKDFFGRVEYRYFCVFEVK